MFKFAAALIVTSLASIASASATDLSQATAVRLLSMPGVPASLQLVDIGVMPEMVAPGTLVMLCDAQCQAVMHLAAQASPNNGKIAMGMTLNVDAHSTAARLLGGK
jgi:hypothetical protein